MMALLRRRYGASPVHLLAHLVLLPLAGWAALQALSLRGARDVAAWFLAALILHDLVGLPLYSALDRVAQRARVGGVAAVNHVRFVAVVGGVSFLVFFPLILGKSDGSLHYLSGVTPTGYLERWLLLCAGAALLATLALAVRVRRRLLLLAALATLAGCGSQSVHELPPAAGPARAPATTAVPTGRVVPLGSAGAGVGADPRRVAFDDGSAIAVVAGRERVLERYDARPWRRTARIPAGVGPTHVAAAGDLLFVADTRGGALLVVATHPKLQVLRRVDLPGAPYGMAVDPVRGRLWVTLTARNQLVGLTATSHPRVVARMPTVRQPDRVAVDPSRGTVAVTGRAVGVVELIDPPR